MLATAGVTSSAAADPAIRVELSPAALSFPDAGRLEYRIEIKTGAAVERFSLELRVPLLPDGGAGLEPIGLPILDGPGVVTGGSTGVATPGCSPTHNVFHGYEPITNRVDLLVPANKSTSLVASYRSGAFTPWPGADVGVRIRTLRRLTNGEAGTLTVPERGVPSPEPRLVLERSGVRLALWTRPHSDSSITGRASRIAHGRSITVAGSTWPRLRHERVRLAVIAPGSARLETLGWVRTNRHGRFRYRGWRPRALGRYQLWVFSTGRDRRYVADHRCPRGFRLVAGRGA